MFICEMFDAIEYSIGTDNHEVIHTVVLHKKLGHTIIKLGKKLAYTFPILDSVLGAHYNL